MSLRLFISIVALGSSLAASVGQQLTIQSKTIQPPEMGPLTILDLGYAAERFIFVPPVTWQIQTDRQAATLQFFSPQGTMVIALRFTTNSARQALSSANALRQQVIPNLSDAALIEEFPAQSGGGAGKGLDLGFNLSGRVMRCRAIAVPFAKGCVHFVLTCGADEFKTGQQTLGAILTSFQQANAAANQ